MNSEQYFILSTFTTNSEINKHLEWSASLIEKILDIIIFFRVNEQENIACCYKTRYHMVRWNDNRWNDDGWWQTELRKMTISPNDQVTYIDISFLFFYLISSFSLPRPWDSIDTEFVWSPVCPDLRLQWSVTLSSPDREILMIKTEWIELNHSRPLQLDPGWLGVDGDCSILQLQVYSLCWNCKTDDPSKSK